MPILSPTGPSNIPPNGLTKKLTAKTPQEYMMAASGFELGKNFIAKIDAADA